eukprot:800323-Amphidinium_carterae.1
MPEKGQYQRQQRDGLLLAHMPENGIQRRHTHTNSLAHMPGIQPRSIYVFACGVSSLELQGNTALTCPTA